MFCKYCGTKNEQNATFCTGCGRPLNGSQNRQNSYQNEQRHYQNQQEDYQGSKPKSLNLILILGIIIMLLGILGGGATLILPKILDNKEDARTQLHGASKETQTSQLLESETTQAPSTTVYVPILETESQMQSTEIPKETQKEEKYKIVTGSFNWEEAQARCEEMGGYLVQINDYQEWRYLTEKFIPSQNIDNTKFLIGGRRDISSEEYYWVKNGQKVGNILNNPTSWIDQNDIWFYSSKQRQPSFYDDESKEGEYYLQMFYIEDTSSNREKGRKIGWSINDIALSEEMSFICEFD